MRCFLALNFKKNFSKSSLTKNLPNSLRRRDEASDLWLISCVMSHEETHGRNWYWIPYGGVMDRSCEPQEE